MPIKFRCTHCRQLLGISRSKAGEVFDCPTCGRTLRVPRLDGTSDPIPVPALNLNDSSLLSALDELAMIGQTREPDSGDEVAVAEPPGAAAAVVKPVSAPAPRPAPIPVEAPLPPEPVVKPRPSAEAATSPAGSNAESAANALAGLAAHSTGETLKVTASGNRRGVSRGIFWGTMAATAAVAFAAGLGAGTFVARGHRNVTPVEAAGSGEPAPPAADARREATPGPAISGRISYESPSGRRPDRGARVLVLPATKPGQARLLASTFRDDEASPDFRLARASLEALGGKVAVADEQGNFAIDLAENGVYRILVLSHFQSREMQEPVDSTLQQQLAAWFDRPDQLLGQLAFHTGEVRYNGSRTELWDHTFPAPL